MSHKHSEAGPLSMIEMVSRKNCAIDAQLLRVTTPSAAEDARKARAFVMTNVWHLPCSKSAVKESFS